MMEKRNVATSRRAVDDDEEELRREASLFGKTEKRASSPSDAGRADEEFDEDTGTGDRRPAKTPSGG